uniref:DNA-directed DNA polymerase n=1 Tax=Globodera rostochiensis TaxID=31243 RepID=A0A914H8X8_GLORO
MMSGRRKEFDRWFELNQNQPFLLDESLARAEFLEMTKRLAGSNGKADRAAYKTPHNGVENTWVRLARMLSMLSGRRNGDGGPINIRGCFMGGRAGALKLFHAAAPDEKISYYDFTSLYPFIKVM